MLITLIHQIFANRFLFFREISFISEIGFAELKVRIKKTFRVNSYIIPYFFKVVNDIPNTLSTG